MKPYNMNKDIAEFKIYRLQRGKLRQIFWIKSTNDYNHSYFALHHYILKQEYERDSNWFIERGIEQKLILLPVPIHNQLHHLSSKLLSDEQFKSHFGISRWDLLFNRKHSKY